MGLCIPVQERRKKPSRYRKRKHKHHKKKHHRVRIKIETNIDTKIEDKVEPNIEDKVQEIFAEEKTEEEADVDKLIAANAARSIDVKVVDWCALGNGRRNNFLITTPATSSFRLSAAHAPALFNSNFG